MNSLDKFFKALSDITRLRIIALLLWKEELCVCDIENVLKLPQSKVSRHLRYLLNLNILKDKRKNVWVYYSLNKNLGKNEFEFIDVFNKIIESDNWKELKDELEVWLKKKKETNSCKINNK